MNNYSRKVAIKDEPIYLSSKHDMRVECIHKTVYGTPIRTLLGQ